MRRQPFRIVLIGPHALFREGLAHILCDAHFRVVASAACLSDLPPNAFQRNNRIILIIESNDDLDSALPQIKLFKEQLPSGRVAVLGSCRRPADIVAAFQAGANAYFDSEDGRDAFIKALELVMLGETILPQELLFYVQSPEAHDASSRIDRHLTQSMPNIRQRTELEWPQLSFRENCILRCIVEGASNKVIARKIDITEATVKVHVKAILRKIRVHNRTQAAIWAMKHVGLVGHASNNLAKESASMLAGPPDIPLLAGHKAEKRRNGVESPQTS
jgi:two-component system, NarL family, nitrate/nitrite response regulator NarL